ncbi:MAG TPA: hypothetical protein VMS86_05165 [Thermoanaerobaculia bacterium]|nr:hypothetical protein [Thermoanaerobaculia bacterium]
MKSRLVVHFLDGSLIKGWSTDLFPNKPTFHVNDSETEESREVHLADLKGVFFVKELARRPVRSQRRYDIERPGLGRRVRVTFRDGEVVEGYTNGYSPDRLAFFVFPPDPDDNTERILVVTQATADVQLV